MNIDIFVRQLAEAAPFPLDLERCGLGREQADEFMRSFHCVKRQRALLTPGGSDPVLQLLRNWDLTTVEIGMVRFAALCGARPGAICIGSVEADPLVLSPKDGEILVHELGTNEHVLWRVAQNGSALLDALLIAARFLGKRAVGAVNLHDYEAARSVALECASAAGGDRFVDFYKMLLGAE